MPSRRERMRPANESERLWVAFAAFRLQGFDTHVYVDAFAKQLAAPAELDCVVVRRNRTHGVADVTDIVAIESRGASGCRPQLTVRRGQRGANRIVFGIAIGGVADDPSVISIPLDIEQALVVRAVIV